MKYLVLISLFIFPGYYLNGQATAGKEEGRVSYITTQHVYVKFKSTDGIAVGDTLFVERDGKMILALQVTGLSSISCVCLPLSNIKLKTDDAVVAMKAPKAKQKIESITKEKVEVTTPVPVVVPTTADTTKTVEAKTNKQEIRGRLSVSSYSNLSNTPGRSSQRMRYTFSLRAANIANSNFSINTYISFVHSNVNWNDIKKNVFNGLKVYDLNIKYQPVKSLSIWLGRRINPNLSSVGAIDGLQVENNFGKILIGGFAGSRPDYQDYSFNFKLFQFGLYFGHIYTSKKKREMRTTVAFIDQENNWSTDRRFIYLQHSNALAKNLYFFGTAELELYQKVNDTAGSTFNLTNLYLMLRYRVIKQLSFSVSYSSRKNLIYYESYKDFVERLLDEGALQGIRFQITYRPVRNLSIGVKTSYRARKQDPAPSKNLYAFVTFSRVPGIGISATLSATLLQTSYLSGGIYSINLSRDLLHGKLYAGAGYRYVDYRQTYYDTNINQHVTDVNLNWRIIRRLSLSVAWEAIFQQAYTYQRIFVNLTARL